MSSYHRQKGTQFETAVVQYARTLGLDAERLRQSGRDDQGDAVISDIGIKYIAECKNEKAITLASYVDEAQLEARNYAKARGLTPDKVMGIAVVKRRGKPVSESYVVTTLADFLGADLSSPAPNVSNQ